MTSATDCRSSGCSAVSGEAEPLNCCASIPFALVWAYTERPFLSKELLEKLRTARSDIGLAHAVAITGPGGTGKTQLVLRFIEEHEEEYNIILWIDLQSESAVRSSFERCCRALCLPIDDSIADGPLQDLPCVRAVISLLRNSAGNKKWLVVIDNADDLSWDIDALIPKRNNGTVIVTSRNVRISQTLGWHIATMKVDAMEMEEAVTFVLNGFEVSMCQENICRKLVKEIARCLHWNVLAMELAAARIQVDVENEEHLAAALRGYLSDYRYSRKRLLLDQDFANADDHIKAVRTACAVSLSSLRRIHNSWSNIFPFELLSFMTLLGQTGAQDELFRLASLGLEDSCSRLDVQVPAWMRRLLSESQGDEWDDTAYRATIRVLWRYRLVTPVSEPWRGITLHNIVRCQASMSIKGPEYWRWYIVFIAAACVQFDREAHQAHFRRHLVVHLPSNKDLPELDDAPNARGLRWLWSTIARVLWKAHKWRSAEELVMRVIMASSRLLGDEHPDAISAVANLATVYCSQGRWIDAEVLDVKVLNASLTVLGKEHLETITAMDSLAATYKNLDRSEEAKGLLLEVLKLRIKALGIEHPDTITAMSKFTATYWHRGQWKVKDIDTNISEARAMAIGGHYRDTVRAVGNFAATHKT